MYKKTFDKAARNYSDFSSNQLRIANKLIAFTDQIQPSDKILDIGCGTGYLGSITKKVKKQNFIQSDLSENMCREASSANKMPTVNAEMENLPFQDSSFNILLSSMSIHWTKNLKKTISEFFRVLKHNGKAFISYPITGTMSELLSALKTTHDYEYNPFFTKDTENLFTNAGFSTISEIENYIEHYPSFRHLCREIKNNGTFLFAYEKRKAKINPFAISQKYKSKYKDSNGIQVSWKIVYMQCIKV